MVLRKIYRALRMAWFRAKYGLKQVHPTFYMGGSSDVQRDLKAGAYSYIGRNCIVYPRVSIGNYTMLANNVSIVGADHVFDKAGVPTIFAGKEELSETIIGRDVWIGAFSKVRAGVTIGDGAIIAMGSVVTRDVEPFSVYAGVPAKKLRDRFADPIDRKKHEEMLEETPSSLGFGVGNIILKHAEAKG